MSRSVECPECGKSLDVRGLSGHLMMKHGITGSEQQEITDQLLEGGDDDDQPDHPTPEPTEPTEPAPQPAAADGGQQVAACQNCGNADQVVPIEQLQQQAAESGQQLKPEVARHEHWCQRCSVAFGGDLE